MKKIHLLCNAHLDPVWLWGRNDGIAEAISTFRVAADFCEKYDTFIFNHNESLLYEWVEEYEPELFERINKLVAAGKWHIMGGWYLQPDCLLPSGEGFLRQIEVGNKYFLEKFGVKPTTAINFDPFGHSRGLVQIMKKCGYDSYIFMRPIRMVEERDFIWRGYDGSEIVGHCLPSNYGTLKGQALSRLEKQYNEAHEGANLMLWGIGNHGGGPSKIDLEAINDFAAKHPEVEIINSTPEAYFGELEKDNLRVIDKPLVHCMIGCYTTMARIKQEYRGLENDLVLTEKMLAASGLKYDEKQLEDAQKSMLFCQFHDILPGTMIKKAETETLHLIGHSREILSRLKMRAFMKLSAGQEKGKTGEIPVLIFNPNPYYITEDIEVEFLLENQNWAENTVTIARVRDKNGNYITCQNEKESSSLTLDWVKRIVFRAELEPMSMNRFDCELVRINEPRRPVAFCKQMNNCYIMENERMTVHINKSTGLIDEYSVDGIQHLGLNSAKINVYKDNEDPWGMTVNGFYDKIGEFELLSDDEANNFNGYPDARHENVRVIENGDLRTKIQAIFKNRNSYAVITYTIPKNSTYVDIKIKAYSNDVNSMYKLSFNTTLENFDFLGQTAFGREVLEKEEQETVYQKWCAAQNGKNTFVVMNRGTYGGSAKDNVLNISLLRTPIYSAHPIDGRPISDDDISHDHIDMGEREFDFRLTTQIDTVDKDAEIYNQAPYALPFFPSGEGERAETGMEIENPKIIMSAYKPIDGNARLVRLYNTSSENIDFNIKIFGKNIAISMTPYEIKGYILKNGMLFDSGIIPQKDTSPIKLMPAIKDYLWGGKRLINEYNKSSCSGIAAESWELSSHPDGEAVVDGGKYNGLKFSEYLAKTHGVMGEKCKNIQELPVLIKLIDADKDLSVQVHPNEKYAQLHHNQHGKTEMWHILDCREGAFIYYGFKRNVGEEEYEGAIKNNSLTELLNRVYVKKGDTFLIEAGTVHAIGAGIVVCEIQQNSNITYRIYDYDRTDKNGERRVLHIADAIAVSDTVPAPPYKNIAFGNLVSCDKFTVDKIFVSETEELKITNDSFVSVIAINGSGTISIGSDEIEFKKGDSVFIPAQNATAVVCGYCELIVTKI